VQNTSKSADSAATREIPEETPAIARGHGIQKSPESRRISEVAKEVKEHSLRDALTLVRPPRRSQNVRAGAEALRKALNLPLDVPRPEERRIDASVGWSWWT